MACIDEYEKKEFGSLEEEKIKLELQLADIAGVLAPGKDHTADNNNYVSTIFS